MRAPQATLLRFVRAADGWTRDAARSRAPGRGAYLCSKRCAERVARHKRYPGLARAAEGAIWDAPSDLCEGETGRV